MEVHNEICSIVATIYQLLLYWNLKPCSMTTLPLYGVLQQKLKTRTSKLTTSYKVEQAVHVEKLVTAQCSMLSS